MPTDHSIGVVIPVSNDAVRLHRLLEQLKHFDLLEIVVVDGGSQDGSQVCAKQFGQTRLIETFKGRGHQIALGVECISADYIWVLHADSVVPDDALREIRNILAHPSICLGCFPIKFDVNHPLLRFFAVFSQFDTPLTTFGDQGFFFRRRDLEVAGGIEPWPLLEDVALRKTLLRSGKAKVRKSALYICTSARRFVRRGMLRTQFKNAWVLLRYFCGVDPQKLYDEYYRY